MSQVEDKQSPMVCGPEVGDMYSVGTDFYFRMPDLRRMDEEVDELMGSDVPTTRGTSACTSKKKSGWEADATAERPVMYVRRVTLKYSSFSLESRGRKKQKSRVEEARNRRAENMNANYALQIRSFPLQ